MAKVVRVDELKTGDEILIKLRPDSAARNRAIILSVELWHGEVTLELTCPVGDYWEDWIGKYVSSTKVVLMKRE
ncbi:hypothetical protein cory_23 [Pseudomonas phage cory]|nr:hypothetical protein cory_23 [Pseudomonas phage cory]